MIYRRETTGTRKERTDENDTHASDALVVRSSLVVPVVDDFNSFKISGRALRQPAY